MQTAHEDQAADLLLRSGTLVDGTGGPTYRADILIRSGTIAEIGNLGKRSHVHEIDCADLYVAPGFIDAHSHADFTLSQTPAARTLLDQGVTTVVTGNCGFSPFPSLSGTDEIKQFPGSFFNPSLDHLWPDLESFRQALEARGVAVNVAPLIGHGSVRTSILGPDASVAGNDQVKVIVSQMRTAMEQGSFGVSLGLAYPEGRHADPRELARVASLVAKHGGVLAVHLRDERDGCQESVREILSLAASTGVALQISHLKAMGRQNWGSIPSTLALVDDARAQGIDVGMDMYPYVCGATKLSHALPQWADEGGGERLRTSLENRQTRDRLIRELVAGKGYVRLDEIALASVSEHWRHLQGKSLVGAAAEVGRSPADLLLDILADDGGSATMLVTAMDEGDVDAVLRHPTAIVGSDGWVLEAAPGAHPRNFDTFVRTLIGAKATNGTLADAVRRQTYAVAKRFGIFGRGRLAPGGFADIVVFDLEGLAEGSTQSSRTGRPSGIQHVVVNGLIAHGPLAGSSRGGRILKRETRAAAEVQ